MSDTSDRALLPGLGLFPLPDLWRSRLVLLVKDWFSCSGMLVMYFCLVLFFSVGPSSVSLPIRDLVCTPLWEFLCSAIWAD